MPKYFVRIVETVELSYEDVIEADSPAEAVRIHEDWIVNYSQETKPKSEKHVAVLYDVRKSKEVGP